jgi:hypothetical protein
VNAAQRKQSVASRREASSIDFLTKRGYFISRRYNRRGRVCYRIKFPSFRHLPHLAD